MAKDLHVVAVLLLDLLEHGSIRFLLHGDVVDLILQSYDAVRHLSNRHVEVVLISSQ